MARWTLTLTLGVATIAVAAIAPRILPYQAPPASPDGAPSQDDPGSPRGIRAPRLEAVPARPQGPLVVRGGLDRTVLLQGTSDEHFLTIHVTAPDDLGREVRRPIDLAVVLDVSGSMSARGKIAYAKEAAKWLATSMTDQDRYSLVTFSDEARVVMDGVGGQTARAQASRIDDIVEGGSTNLFGGLAEGAATLTRGPGGRVRRLVVLSDGKANVGPADPTSLGRAVGEMASAGITVSTVGLGLEFEEDVLASLAASGGGSYNFVDSPSEIQSVFADELRRTAHVVARRTTVEVVLADGVQGLEILGWEAHKSADGWSVPIGDLHAGETRKIVARVRVRAGTGPTMALAKIEADYHDVSADSPAISYDAAEVGLTPEAARAANAWDRERAIDAQRAWGNHQMSRSTRAFEQGDADTAVRLAREGAAVLRLSAENFQEPSLLGEARDVEEIGTIYGASPASSDDARLRVKQAKEWYLDRAR